MVPEGQGVKSDMTTNRAGTSPALHGEVLHTALQHPSRTARFNQV